MLQNGHSRSLSAASLVEGESAASGVSASAIAEGFEELGEVVLQHKLTFSYITKLMVCEESD